MNKDFKNQVLAAYEAARQSFNLTSDGSPCRIISGRMDTPSYEDGQDSVRFSVAKHTDREETDNHSNEDIIYLELGCHVWGGLGVSTGITEHSAVQLALALLQVAATEVIRED